jgi:hypothetical protein
MRPSRLPPATTTVVAWFGETRFRMREVLGFIRFLALGGFGLSVIAVPLGAILLLGTLPADRGDNGLGDIIGIGLGVGLLVLGTAGLTLGGGLAVLAKRALAAPAEIRGSRRIVLAIGLAIAAGQLLIGIGLDVLSPDPRSGSLLVGLSAAFAAAFLIVAGASSRRSESVVAGVLTLALLGLGGSLLAVQAVQYGGAVQSADRAAMLPVDMSVAIESAAVVAPDGWAVALIVAIAPTNAGMPTGERELPVALVGRPLRGQVVADCAGFQTFEVTTWDGDAQVVIGSRPCLPEPQIVAFEAPGTVEAPPIAYVQRIGVAPVPNDGSASGMSRAMIIVALMDTPDPDRDAVLATFVAAFGMEEPR